MADTTTPWCTVDGHRALGPLCARHLSEQQRAAAATTTAAAAPAPKPAKKKR